MTTKAMILAAGLGKRMRPLTDQLPKPLISVAGKSMLERTFEHLERAGIQSIVINSHYLASHINDFISRHYPETQISHEEILLETGGGIKKALPLLSDKPFFTLNGDSVWTGPNSIQTMKKLWDGTKMDALLLLILRDKAHGYEGRGDFFLSEQNRLTRPKEGEIAPYVYIGVQCVHPRLFEGAPDGPYSMNVLWNKALQNGRLYGCLHEGDWFHISTPHDLETFEPIIANLESQLAS